jgi:hypothetical protein
MLMVWLAGLAQLLIGGCCCACRAKHFYAGAGGAATVHPHDMPGEIFMRP